MQIFAEIFYVLIFLSVIGSLLSILSLLAQKILKLPLPIWFCVISMSIYIIPLLSPNVSFFSPEENIWHDTFYIACTIWLCGVVLLFIYEIVRVYLLYNRTKKYYLCDDDRINNMLRQCIILVGLKKIPVIYFSTIESPACVIGFIAPKIMLNKAVITKLSDNEIMAILCHELTHIKRGHLVFKSIYNLISILHWFNPIVWISKKDFSLYCEMDCDTQTLNSLIGKVSETQYANIILSLVEDSMIKKRTKSSYCMSATGFILTKNRIEYMLFKPTKIKRYFTITILSLIILATTILSCSISETYYYPFPAISTQIEFNNATN